MRRTTTRRSLIAAASAVALMDAATDALANESTPTAGAPDSILPDTPAGQQMAWVVSIINGEREIADSTGIEANFAPSFLDILPASDLIATFQQLQAALAPLEVTEIVGLETPLMLNVVTSTRDGSQIVVSISVEDGDDHLIDGLLFAPYDQQEIEFPTFGSWEEVSDALASDSGSFGISVSHLNGEDLEPVNQVQEDVAFAIGSLFKLYVLAAVVTTIEAGDLAWSDEIEVVEEYLSYPSGVTQSEPLGTMISVEVLASRMISISDNTATDLLLHHIGRDAVEQALGTLGNSVPELNRPFLSTREMFLLKLGDEDTRNAFVAANEADRRAQLDELSRASLPPIADVVAWTSPVAIDTIEWFATVRDIEHALLWLRDAWARPGLEPVKDIMMANLGVPFDRDIWSQVAFKGGSEPGVLALGWLLERSDGEVFTFALAVNDPTTPLDQEGITLTAGGAVALLEA
ncbi:MAG: serine hydrolase [Thermomicrobiales bacterium]